MRPRPWPRLRSPKETVPTRRAVLDAVVSRPDHSDEGRQGAAAIWRGSSRARPTRFMCSTSPEAAPIRHDRRWVGPATWASCSTPGPGPSTGAVSPSSKTTWPTPNECADLGRAERARAERDFIATELAAALGLGGRPRRTGDPAERARKAVTGRIRLTIGRIDREAPRSRPAPRQLRTHRHLLRLPARESRSSGRCSGAIWHRHTGCSASTGNSHHPEGAPVTVTETTADRTRDPDRRVRRTALRDRPRRPRGRSPISLGRELGLYDHLTDDGGVTAAELASGRRHRRPLRAGVARAAGRRRTHRRHRRQRRRRRATLRPLDRRPGVPAPPREPRLGRPALRPPPRGQPGLPGHPRRRLPHRRRDPVRRLRPPRRPGRLQPARLREPPGVGLARTDPRPHRPSPGARSQRGGDRLRRGLGGDLTGQGVPRDPRRRVRQRRRVHRRRPQARRRSRRRRPSAASKSST